MSVVLRRQLLQQRKIRLVGLTGQPRLRRDTRFPHGKRFGEIAGARGKIRRRLVRPPRRRTGQPPLRQPPVSIVGRVQLHIDHVTQLVGQHPMQGSRRVRVPHEDLDPMLGCEDRGSRSAGSGTWPASRSGRGQAPLPRSTGAAKSWWSPEPTSTAWPTKAWPTKAPRRRRATCWGSRGSSAACSTSSGLALPTAKPPPRHRARWLCRARSTEGRPAAMTITSPTTPPRPLTNPCVEHCDQ